MSEGINDGGPAFPWKHTATAGSVNALTGKVVEAGKFEETYYKGMTLRDWYAGRFAQEQIGFEGMEGCDKDQIAAMAYEMADAMLKKREERHGG